MELGEAKSQLNLQLMALCMVKNSETKIHHENGKFICLGLPTEGALMSLGHSMINVN